MQIKFQVLPRFCKAGMKKKKIAVVIATFPSSKMVARSSVYNNKVHLPRNSMQRTRTVHSSHPSPLPHISTLKNKRKGMWYLTMHSVHLYAVVCNNFKDHTGSRLPPCHRVCFFFSNSKRAVLFYFNFLSRKIFVIYIMTEQFIPKCLLKCQSSLN